MVVAESLFVLQRTTEISDGGEGKGERYDEVSTR